MIQFIKGQLLGPILVASILAIAAWLWSGISPGFAARLFGCVPRADYEALQARFDALQADTLHYDSTVFIARPGTDDIISAIRDTVSLKAKNDPDFKFKKWVLIKAQ